MIYTTYNTGTGHNKIRLQMLLTILQFMCAIYSKIQYERFSYLDIDILHLLRLLYRLHITLNVDF